MISIAFLAAAFDRAAVDEKTAVAVLFFERLGNENAAQTAIERVAAALAVAQNPAGVIMDTAAENYTSSEIEDAALYTARES